MAYCIYMAYGVYPHPFLVPSSSSDYSYLLAVVPATTCLALKRRQVEHQRHSARLRLPYLPYVQQKISAGVSPALYPRARLPLTLTD